jgi:TPR repeat protein
LNLGWRYEHGRGILRNVEEAARCYAKAGRLSEAWDTGKG